MREIGDEPCGTEIAGSHDELSGRAWHFDGWRIVEELQDLANKAIILPKHHFGSNLWEEYIQPGDEVTMVGFVSSICVVSNALSIKQIENVEVNVIKDCCAGLTNEDHEAAMTVMKCCQCNII